MHNAAVAVALSVALSLSQSVFFFFFLIYLVLKPVAFGPHLPGVLAIEINMLEHTTNLCGCQTG